MGGEAGGMDAPWDSKGRPLGKGGGMGGMGGMGGSPFGGGMGGSRTLSSPLGDTSSLGGSKDTK